MSHAKLMNECATPFDLERQNATKIGWRNRVDVIHERFICSEIDLVTYGHRETVMRGMIDTMDAQVREKLIALGWTPPKKGGSSER